jgi:hypothetical protein
MTSERETSSEKGDVVRVSVCVPVTRFQTPPRFIKRHRKSSAAKPSAAPTRRDFLRDCYTPLPSQNPENLHHWTPYVLERVRTDMSEVETCEENFRRFIRNTKLVPCLIH